MNICVYGAASNSIAENYIKNIELLGETIAKKGHCLVFGGGNNGAMGAAARGVKRYNGKIIGVAPRFFDADGVLFPYCDEFIYTETMRERKKILEDKADVFIIAPGGIGTFDEFFEIVTLKQLGRTEKPIVIFNIYGYYDHLIAMLNNAVNGNFMNKATLSLFKVLDNINEIFSYIENYKFEKSSLNEYKDINLR